MSSVKRKILLLGATDYDANNDEQTLRSVSWTAENFPNPRDFDIVIISLLDFDSTQVDWMKFHEAFHHRATRDILYNLGRIIIIGDPRFRIPPVNNNGIHGLTFPFLDWTGIDFEWDGHVGDTMIFSTEKRHDRYHEFAKHVRSWKYSLASCSHKTKYVPLKKDSESFYERLAVDGWLTNRYQHQIAFDVVLSYGKDVYDCFTYVTSFKPEKIGRIIFLPPLEISSDDTIRMVLRDICGFDAGAKEPAWVLDLTAPDQISVDENIKSVTTQIGSLQEALRKLQAERENKRSCLKLLYEREFVLEPIVWEILRRLGAQVEEPIAKNKEDGWISVRVCDLLFEGVLEIKSTRKDHFTEDGRKQVVDWVQKGISEREKKYKGVFIGNSAVDKPVDNRPNPFPDSWAKAAKLSEICAFTTSQLLRAYELDNQGKLDRTAFWKSIFECSGVCSFVGVLE
jgi:hypothetical protein